MAKPKKSVLVDQLPNHFLRIWCNDPKRWISELLTVEGICVVDDLSTGCLMLHCDHRYDMSELAEEINTLLKSEVPEIFKE